MGLQRKRGILLVILYVAQFGLANEEFDNVYFEKITLLVTSVQYTASAESFTA